MGITMSIRVHRIGTNGFQNSSRRSVRRRRALLGIAVGGLLLGLLSACSSSAGSAPGGSVGGGTSEHGLTELPGGTPVRGGTFTAGVMTGGSAENLFPGTAAGNPDMARDANLYDLLFNTNSEENLFPVSPGLALSAEPNATATSWTLKLRDGVLWHDGKPFGADDVVYNFKVLWSDPNANYSAGFLAGVVDFDNVRAVDNLTVEIPLLVPMAEFPSILGFMNFGVLQDGATAESTAGHPIGTGPFKFESFTPGQQSVFVANKDYWEEGKPYVDQLVINSSFTDNSALLNSLLSDSINLLIGPGLTQARAQLAAKQVQVLEAASPTQIYAFGMRVDEGPFADNRVREAFKLLVDRQAMINGAFAGFGEVGNDLVGPYTQHFANDLTVKQDLAKATELFKEAGVAGTTFDWPTAPVFPGMVESTTILAEQAKAAGVNINVQVGASGTYYTPAGGAYERYASVQVMQPSSSLTTNYRALLTRDAPYPDTHWGWQKPGGEDAEALIAKAIAANDPAAAEDLWHQVQEQQFNEGGYVVWGRLPYIDMAGNNVRGLKTSGVLNFNQFRFLDGWLV